MKTGKVYLVGVGPGDKGLITTKELDCLAKADVVVYDHLMDAGLLDEAPATSEKIYAGKKASQHAMEQVEINALLVSKAKEGKTVVRLKGGDPFVFGRGGEEADALAQNNIPFEIVPGISSAIAVPAYAGIPVTHRGVASSFAIITGHEDPTKSNSSIKWDKLATGVDTLVFLMGMENLSQIADKLVENGRPSDTPVAVIKKVTFPAQQTVVGTLQDIAVKVKKAQLGPPAVIVVGGVVSLREKLRWFDNRPLSGKRVLVTRARQQASALSKLLAECGAQPVELPAIDIRPLVDYAELDRAVRELKKYDWVFFTSVNGVEAFFERLKTLKLDSRAFHGLKVGAIGPATVKVLERYGITADFRPPVFSAAGILAGLQNVDFSNKIVLLPRADIADSELTDGLQKLGAEVHDVAAYRTLPAEGIAENVRSMITSGRIDAITFASSSTVTNLVNALGGTRIPGDVVIACIGPKTADTAKKAGLKVDVIATEQTIPGLVAAMETYYKNEVKNGCIS